MIILREQAKNKTVGRVGGVDYPPKNLYNIYLKSLGDTLHALHHFILYQVAKTLPSSLSSCLLLTLKLPPPHHQVVKTLPPSYSTLLIEIPRCKHNDAIHLLTLLTLLKLPTNSCYSCYSTYIPHQYITFNTHTHTHYIYIYIYTHHALQGGVFDERALSLAEVLKSQCHSLIVDRY